jgi:hypothetical protein
MLVPTYHPAAALRGGDRITDLMRKDFDIMRALLDRPIELSAPTHDRVDPVDDPEQLGLFG